MPELPEVETVRKSLESKIINKKIINAFLYVEKALRNNFNIQDLSSEEFVNVHRKGKQLVIETNKYWIALHLRMEGKIFYYNYKPSMKHAIISFELNEGWLVFYDHRKFATIDIYLKEEHNDWKEIDVIKKIGPEPWDINEIELFKLISNKRRNIKATLLDQQIIAGLGNIYVNEVLYISQISPHKITNEINLENLKLIIQNSKKVLEKAILSKGTTIRSYQSSEDEKGQNQFNLKVHTKDECPNGHKLIFEKVGGRGTFWCKECQK